MKKQHTPQSIDELIEKLDKRLIANGYKPTEPANKSGTFVYIPTKQIKKIKKDEKSKNNDKIIN